MSTRTQGKRTAQTNHGAAVDWRNAGPRPLVAPCPIPETIRTAAISINGIRRKDLNLKETLQRACLGASLECAHFHVDDCKDAEIKNVITPYIQTWLIPLLIQALEKSERLRQASDLLSATLLNINSVSSYAWELDVKDQFEAWAKSRARDALEKVKPLLEGVVS